jgi:hypothetical protein
MTKRVVLVAMSALAITTLQTGCSDKALTYQTDIKPILEANCVSCHVPGEKGYEKSGLLLNSYEGLMKGTKFGAVVVPGSSVSSTMYRLVSGKADPTIHMPHGKSLLPKETVAMIGSWIDQGAKY